MRILGIDPGLANTGWGVIDHDGRRTRMIESGCVATPAGADVALRLRQIHDSLSQVIERLAPEVAAIEMLFFSTNVATAISVAQGRGVAILATAEARLPLFEYSPVQIKQAITGSGRADKEQVQRMVRALLGLAAPSRPSSRKIGRSSIVVPGHALEKVADAPPDAETPPAAAINHHAADALAVAICHAHTNRFQSATAAALASAIASARGRSRRLPGPKRR